jgi:hypothetical protein
VKIKIGIDMKNWIFFTTQIFFLFFLQKLTAQLPEPTQEFRGLWVTQFKANILGNIPAEDALIEYAIANDFNYLICTNMFQILTGACGSFTADMAKLQAFVEKAHEEGIEYISGNVGTLATAEKIQAYNNCVSVTNLQKLDMITYECEFYNAATNGSCPSYASFISQLTSIKSICTSTPSSVPGRPLVCEAYIGGEGSTGLVLTYSTEIQMEAIASVADHILITYYRPTPFSSSGNFFNWTIGRLKWIAKVGTPSNIVLLLKSRNTDDNNMNAYLSSFSGTHYNAVRDPYLSWVDGTAHNPSLTKGYREKYPDSLWLSGIQVKGFTWFEHDANMALGAITLAIDLTYFDVTKTLDNNAHILWTNASDQNIDYFEVQNSKDGEKWLTLKLIKRKGNNGEAQSYSYIDKTPIIGQSYYRIKQVDKSKKFSYSDTKSFTLDIASDTLFFFPNPAENLIIVPSYSKEGIDHIQIFNTLGQKIQNFTFKNQTSELSLDISSLARGVYLLQMNGVIKRFIKG